MKVTLYDPDAMRLGGTLPVYEIFMEKEKQQFLTYDRAHDKWRTAKIDYLEWQAKGSNNVWISAVDDAQIRQYLVSDEKNVYRAILKFQRAVRDAELERRHRKETDPWDAELSQTPPLPKDWERWVNKVGIQENYIFYDYRKGGARYGYCTYCEKEVTLKQRPYHNAVGKCPRCRHKITFKAKGKITDYLHSPTECAYLAQKCGDGFVVRQFQVSRQYRKEENTITSKTSSFEKQRIFYRADLSSHSYYMDIFFLDKHRSEIVQMEGFGVRSWQNLWDAIQHSRITTFEQYLTAMDIPMVGSTASRAICQRFHGNLSEFETAVCMGFDFTQLPDFGETLHRNICQWFRSEENWTVWTELRLLVCIKTYQPPAVGTDMSNPFVGKTLVVTGKVEPYTRDGINEKIVSLGAHAGSSVSSKTDYLICGENAGSKLAKAQELGIKILSPDEFFRMAGESA